MVRSAANGGNEVKRMSFLDEQFEIVRIANAVRDSFERVSIRLKSEDPIGKFPIACCNYSSPVLAVYLEDSGIYGFKFLEAFASRDSRHVWIEREDLVVDITADQFKKERVIVGRSQWHRSLDDRRSSDIDIESVVENLKIRTFNGFNIFELLVQEGLAPLKSGVAMS